MTKDERNEALQDFKDAVRQKKRNLGYLIEDIPDIIKEKQLEREVEKEQEARQEYQENLKKAEQYKLRLKMSGVADIPAACQRAQEALDAAKADYERLYQRFADEIPQLSKHRAKRKTGSCLIYIAMILIIVAFFFDSLPFGIAGFAMLVIAAVYHIGVGRSQKADEKYTPPELTEAKKRLDEAEKEFDKMTDLQQTQEEYDEILEKIESYQKKYGLDGRKQ